MNDLTFVEASRKLAERVITEGGGSHKARLTRAFRLVTGRRPDARELEKLTNTLNELLRDYRKDVDAATKLMSVGESKQMARTIGGR